MHIWNINHSGRTEWAHIFPHQRSYYECGFHTDIQPARTQIAFRLTEPGKKECVTPFCFNSTKRQQRVAEQQTMKNCNCQSVTRISTGKTCQTWPIIQLLTHTNTKNRCKTAGSYTIHSSAIRQHTLPDECVCVFAWLVCHWTSPKPTSENMNENHTFIAYTYYLRIE